ncbi:MAG: hypothetical protein Q8R82_17470 [Hyphomonadaceae bacterium]|nr:hypothetical protein [Hyphomonadaceae bacterium]
MNFATLLPELKPALDALATMWPVPLIKESSWAMPAILCLHVLSLTVLGGATLLPALRLMGVGMTSVSPSSIEKTVRPWLWGALIVLAITGLIMVAVNPMKVYRSPAFFVKTLALAPALMLSLGVIRSIASRDGVLTQQARILAAIAAAFWGATILIFATSFFAAPGTLHITIAGWLIVMAFGANRTRIVLGAITAVIIVWMFLSTMLLHNALDDYDLVMEIDRYTARLTALIVGFFLIWEFTRTRPAETAPIANRLIGILAILAWITVAAAGRWIGLGGSGG